MIDRRAVELKAGPLLVLAARLPRAVPFLVVLGLAVAGLLLPGAAGGAVLLVLAGLLGLLLFLSWPVLLPPARLLRSAVLAMLLLKVATVFI